VKNEHCTHGSTPDECVECTTIAVLSDPVAREAYRKKAYDRGFKDGYIHRGKMNYLPGETKTLELSYTDCAQLVAILLHDREVLQTPVDGQPRRVGGVTGQCPTIDDFIQRLDALYPEQKWGRFLE
jgi:hypothetical protein